MKYLRRYSTLNDYISDFLDLKSLPAHVSLVDDTDSMIGKDSQKKTVFVKSTGSTAWAGDLLCWNKSTEDWEVVHVKHTYTDSEGKVHDSWKFDSWDDNLVPDSVCVMPACHTDNGKARWLALIRPTGQYKFANDNNANLSTPIYSLVSICGSAEEKEYVSLHNRFLSDDYTTSNGVRHASDVGGYTNEDGNIYINVYMYRSLNDSLIDIMPGQLKDPVEGNILSIKFDINDADQCTIFLYDNTEDGSLLLKNTQLFKYKNSEGLLNILCDNNGMKNKEIMLSDGIDNFPAAKACHEFSTTYTTPGTWYLPTVGELAYLIARYYTINQTMCMINNTISGSANSLVTHYQYSTSTRAAEYNVYKMHNAFGSTYPAGDFSGEFFLLPMRQF